ncbi:hypothetical protein Ddye_016443 [Dipteronia dyeriana]|uniref:Uncharacterized protein n=1 Tax=Dipteronia dyeriana TaxID=168575 RepID=A0AAD9U785_9ROSI|nr:hypothetical protein Ddye_016443 [Dipteronia dyeriana]
MYLQYLSDRHLCFMSDRQKGLIKAMAKHSPNASKRLGFVQGTYMLTSEQVVMISGIPYPHAMATISHNYGREALRDMVPKYVYQSLTKSAYIQTFMSMIHPLLDKKMWSEIEADEVLSSSFQVQLGRPKIQRKRESGEKGK